MDIKIKNLELMVTSKISVSKYLSSAFISLLKKDKNFEKNLWKSFEFEWIEHKGETKI